MSQKIFFVILLSFCLSVVGIFTPKPCGGYSLFRSFSLSIGEGFEYWGTTVTLSDSIKYTDTLTVQGFKGNVAFGFFFDICRIATFLEIAGSSTPTKELNLGRIFDQLQPMITFKRCDANAFASFGLGAKLSSNTAIFLVGSAEYSGALISSVQDPNAFVNRFNERCVNEPDIMDPVLYGPFKDPLSVLPSDGGVTAGDATATPPTNPPAGNTPFQPPPNHPAGYEWAEPRFTEAAQGIEPAIKDINNEPEPMVSKRFHLITARIGVRLVSMVDDNVSFQIEFMGRFNRILSPVASLPTIKTGGIDCQIRMGYHF